MMKVLLLNLALDIPALGFLVYLIKKFIQIRKEEKQRTEFLQRNLARATFLASAKKAKEN